jgi:protein dithiol oxidoreductase (disulfide-forming)
MQRREFSRISMAATLGAAGLWSQGAAAQAAKFEAGSDYQLVDPRAPVDAPAGKVEVVEFFWYSCPHCNAFEPTLAAWLKRLPAHIAFRRVPVAFREDFGPQQRLYFALESLGLVEKLHAKVFAAIHAEHLPLAKPQAIIEWVGKQPGVDAAKFEQAYNSFGVATKASKATQLQNAYRVEGVPALGVAGRFYTDGTMAHNMERALQVVESLASLVRSGK